MSTANPLFVRCCSGITHAALVAAECQTQFETCLNEAHAQMQSADFVLAAQADTGDFWAFDPDSYMSRLRPYVVRDGILQIPVKGALLNDFPYALGSWATGYDYIWRAFQRGMGDQNVKGIALVCDTPGGMVAGNFELVDKMFAMKGQKPIRGYACESAYSAGYSIISVCDSVTVSRTGGVGSIGVVTGHMDVSGAMEKAGLNFTYVYAGSHKVDGNPYGPLPKDVKARIQTRIDALYAVLVSTVARNRGMEESAVRETEALTFTATEALSNGLADNIGALDDSLADYAADLSDDGDDDMTTQAGTVGPRPSLRAPVSVSAAVTGAVTPLSSKPSAQAPATPNSTIDPKTADYALATATAYRVPGLRWVEKGSGASERPACISAAPEEPGSPNDPMTIAAAFGLPGLTNALPVSRTDTAAASSAAPAKPDPKSAEYALACAAAYGVAGLRRPEPHRQTPRRSP